MVRQTIKNPSNLQIVWDDGVMLVFSFTAADGYETVNCGIAHLDPHTQVGRTQVLSPITAVQIAVPEQFYGDPQTWIETIKSAARGSIPNIQIDYEDQVGIFYNSWNLNSQSSFALQVLYSLAG
jgi:hypothetical protein